MKVLVLDPIHEDGLSILKGHPKVDLVHLPDPDEAAIARHMADAEALLLRGRTLAPGHFEKATRMRLVSRHGVGCDNLDLALLERRGIGVAIAADSNLLSVAEHAMTLTLAALKRLPAAMESARSDWGRRDALGAGDLADQSVLVIGFGRIGQAFARLCRAFGADVAFIDPFVPDGTMPVEGVRRAHDLAEAIARATVASVHVPLSEATTGLLDAATLARFPAGAVLVNTARGGIVDEAALPAALDAGRPAVYATDVLSQEPPPADHPLLGRPDVIVTPHSAALTAGGLRRMAAGAAQNIVDYIDGRLPKRMIALAPRDAERASADA